MPYTRGRFHLKRDYKPPLGLVKKSPKEKDSDVSTDISVRLRLSTLYSKIGLLLARQYKYDQALEGINRALKLNPDNIDAYCTKASILCAKEEYEESIKLCKRALRINKHMAETWIILGNNYKMLAVDEELKGNQDKVREYHELAKDYWGEGKSINPNIIIPFFDE
ncbi:MAG: TPR repeat protein [Candidatus Scalindua rubra]|uniref:TPR repeat protein n=1 Tax=Candidatus Scalindua rubra TaxID=1872076 RepID=A0A1E3XD15_9BACT|nr:MAG: TPR repeat protein [Candidatus Scalindua rubra]